VRWDGKATILSLATDEEKMKEREQGRQREDKDLDMEGTPIRGKAYV
jgi:hypothetical protein